jgi:hypothetical protein
MIFSMNDDAAAAVTLARVPSPFSASSAVMLVMYPKKVVVPLT